MYTKYTENKQKYRKLEGGDINWNVTHDGINIVNRRPVVSDIFLDKRSPVAMVMGDDHVSRYKSGVDFFINKVLPRLTIRMPDGAINVCHPNNKITYITKGNFGFVFIMECHDNADNEVVHNFIVKLINPNGLYSPFGSIDPSELDQDCLREMKENELQQVIELAYKCRNYYYDIETVNIFADISPFLAKNYGGFDFTLYPPKIYPESLINRVYVENQMEIISPDHSKLPLTVGIIMEPLEITLSGLSKLIRESHEDAAVHDTDFFSHYFVFIILQLFSGVHAITKAGYAHRDLKYDNIMFTRLGASPISEFSEYPIAKIIDFGYVRKLTDGQIVGKNAQQAGHNTIAPELRKYNVAEDEEKVLTEKSEVYMLMLGICQLLDDFRNNTNESNWPLVDNKGSDHDRHARKTVSLLITDGEEKLQRYLESYTIEGQRHVTLHRDIIKNIVLPALVKNHQHRLSSFRVIVRCIRYFQKQNRPGERNVSDEILGKIRQIYQRYGFRPDFLIKSLRARRYIAGGADSFE